MKKITCKASPDVALIKYWGKKNEVLRLPMNGSISIVLDGLESITTVEFDTKLKEDEVVVEEERNHKEIQRVVRHLDRLRNFSGVHEFAKVSSKNNFPKATGLSSSGSGFAALTIAVSKALDLKLSEKQLSILARQGSGTACRCVCGGFVEWKDGATSETSYSQTLFPANYWDLRDIVVVVGTENKRVSSTEGHRNATSSLFFKQRQKHIKEKIIIVKELIKDRKFVELGEIIEAEALEFHSILLTSNPAYIAWRPGTIEVINEVLAMRKDKIPAYFTINTGFNVHVLTLPEFEKDVEKRVKKLKMVKSVLKSKVGNGPREISEHLF